MCPPPHLMKGNTMSNLIKFNPKYIEDTTIVRDKWLVAMLGEELDLSQDCFDRIRPDFFLMEEARLIKACIEMEHDADYRMTSVFNTFNDENNFDVGFQYCIYWPADEEDWFYTKNVYIAVEPYKGGDPRGNYGAIRLYKVDECLSDTGFHGFVLGWNVLDVETDEDIDEHGEFQVGYWDNPTQHVVDDMTDFEFMNDHWRATWEGRRVKLIPVVRGE